jgi:alginate O-acetyltransferase complex protein AlgI
MLFSSKPFLLTFLPVAVLLVQGLRVLGFDRGALALLVAASLVFHGWINAWFPVMLAGSVVVNMALGEMIAARRGTAAATRLMQLGLVLNLGNLGLFKYANFFIDNINALTGGHMGALSLLVPLGISYYTFIQIGYLLDTCSGRIKTQDRLSYAVFATFFPYLLAGPIVLYNEIAGQVAERKRPMAEDMAVGLSIFILGMLKKLELADPLADYVDAGFGPGVPAVGLIEAWLLALSYTLQLYFDFSGYSEMALGLGRMFGIMLPLNFAAPLKARSMIEFWQRWHMTMTRFFTAYIYTPLSFTLMRRFPLPAGARTRRFWLLTAIPMVLTFLASGLWHGAAWGYVLFFAIQALGLVVNHAWKLAGWRGTGPVLGWLLTFMTVAASLVFFRAESLSLALPVLRGLIGLDGLGIPPRLLDAVPALGALSGGPAAGDIVSLWLVPRLALSLAVVLLLPSVPQLFRGQLGATAVGVPKTGPNWGLSPGWAAALAALAVWGYLDLAIPRKFIYIQF